MKNTIEVKVVMLPTEWRTNTLQLMTDGDSISYAVVGDYNNISIGGLMQAQHLYFTSDTKIEKYDGSWMLDTRSGAVAQNKNNEITNWNSAIKKIVASTDPLLGLPAIPESFLKQYVAANGKIDKVILEAEYGTTYSSILKMSVSNFKDVRLRLTANNEVVVVEPVTYFPESLARANELVKDLILPTVDKELEDAAKKSLKDYYCRAGYQLAYKEGFIAGANWQKEQSAKRIVELEEKISDLEYRLNH